MKAGPLKEIVTVNAAPLHLYVIHDRLTVRNDEGELVGRYDPAGLQELAALASAVRLDDPASGEFISANGRFLLKLPGSVYWSNIIFRSNLGYSSGMLTRGGADILIEAVAALSVQAANTPRGEI